MNLFHLVLMRVVNPETTLTVKSFFHHNIKQPYIEMTQCHNYYITGNSIITIISLQGR